jgi:hypothetical protein
MLGFWGYYKDAAPSRNYLLLMLSTEKCCSEGPPEGEPQVFNFYSFSSLFTFVFKEHSPSCGESGCELEFED